MHLREKAATIWHAPGKFNKITGERLIVKDNNQPPLFQEVFGRTLVDWQEKTRK